MSTKTIQEIYPGCAYQSDYRPLVEDLGMIVVEVADEDYQGDTRYLLKAGPRWGVLINGWGSCSGCDALQSASSYEELEELRREIAGKVRWFDCAEACAAYLAGKDWETESSYRTEETQRFTTEAIVALGAT